MAWFDRDVEEAIFEALNTQRSKLMPMFARAYDCSARCYESSPSLAAAVECEKPCNNEAKDLGESIQSWTDEYFTHLNSCKTDCKQLDSECLQMCLTKKKEDKVYLGDLGFIVNTFFKFEKQ